MKFMRVAFDVTQAIYGTGVSDYTTSLLSELPGESIQPFSFTLRRRSYIKHLFPSVKILPLGPRVSDVIFNQIHQFPIDPLLSEFDILHTSDWTEPKTTHPKVTTVHDLAPFAYPDATSSLIVKTHSRKLMWVKKESRKIICVSKFTAGELHKYFDIPYSRLEVIYEASAKKLDLKPHPAPYINYILAMGSRQPRKNIARLIEAYQTYKEAFHLPEQLIITGENILSSTDNNILFTGYVSNQELVNLFAHASVFVYPSFYEGFGQPVLEAFKFNVPVVAANTSSIPEIAGDAAVLVDPFSVKAIANGMQHALNHKSDYVAAGQKQLKKFSWATAAKQTLELYQSLC